MAVLTVGTLTDPEVAAGAGVVTVGAAGFSWAAAAAVRLASVVQPTERQPQGRRASRPQARPREQWFLLVRQRLVQLRQPLVQHGR